VFAGSSKGAVPSGARTACTRWPLAISSVHAATSLPCDERPGALTQHANAHTAAAADGQRTGFQRILTRRCSILAIDGSAIPHPLA
jgi:hypothetical protein